MINKLKIVLAATITSTGLLFFAAPQSTLALNCDSPVTIQDQIQCGANGGSGQTSPDSSKASSRLDDIISTTVNVLTIIVGVAAVIMIIIGGLRYIASGGDANKVSSAKNTLLYAILGLIIVALAQVIVHFVLNEATTTSSSSTSSSSSSSTAPQPTNKQALQPQ